MVGMMMTDAMEKEEENRPTIRVVQVRGPLFVCEDSSHLLQKFPQVRKKHYGGAHLSIEELEYMAQFFAITFVNENDVRHREYLRERHGLSCRVYRYMTDEMGLLLRHGSQFGAAFIGYNDIRDHGNSLVYLGPLSQLAAVAAARVACGVSKEAWVIEELHDSSNGSSTFSITKLDSHRVKKATTGRKTNSCKASRRRYET